MMAPPLLIGSLIVALASPGAPHSMVCSLLTPSDVEAATGAKPRNSLVNRESNSPRARDSAAE